MAREPIKGWHFDPRDTDQQKGVLRRNRTAQWVRREFPAGTRIVSDAGMKGVVSRHVPGNAADGGYLVVDWENGHQGRVTLTSQAIKKA